MSYFNSSTQEKLQSLWQVLLKAWKFSRFSMHECNAHFCFLSISSLTSWDVTPRHRWTARVFLRRATWRWQWFCSLVINLGGEEWITGDLGGCGSSTTTSLRSCSKDRTQGHRVFRFVGVCDGFSRQKPHVLTAMAAMPTSVVNLLGALLWVHSAQGLGWKPLTVSLIDGGAVHHYPLGRHRRGVLFPSISIRCHRWQVLVFLVICLFIYDMLCKRGFSLSYIGSAISGFIYKVGWKPVSRKPRHSLPTRCGC
jgi:hypothetical protein